MKKSIIIKLLICVTFLTILGCINNTVQGAAYISTVDSLNESRYPGFKENIKELQNTYPNIKILYTGLDWNTVIKNETSYAHGRNLVEVSKGAEWICQECKNQGKLYDSGLYCASEEAVRYVMDPRNYLNTTDLFQFQKLNTPVGTNKEEIRKVLQMQKVLYLQNDEDAIQAFSTVATNNNLNAYHLITRVIQEQGRNGTTPLSSGLGYSGNGYSYYGAGYYNLFSIGATRKSADPVYMIYINALDKAALSGWNSKAASIIGGGNFVGNGYIDVGQNTLYLQKFAVYNTNGQLYWHQYMQNLFGAQNEAKILYSTYKITGIQNSVNFEFLIPVYENMSSQPSRMPGAIYNGFVTSSQFGEIKSEGNNITGTLVVQEWLNGVQQIEPTVNPKILLKSDDGSYINCEVSYVEPYVYKYSANITSLNIMKEYYIEVICANPNNISNNKTVTRVPQTNKEVGSIYGYYTYMLNNVFTFRYNGYMISYPYTDLIINSNKLEGRLVVQEWIDGNRQEKPKVNPRVMLIAEDGNSVIECEVGYIEPYLYGYSCQEKYIDKSKKYNIYVETGTSKNISSNRKVQVKYKDTTIGQIGNNTVQIKNNKLQFMYDGYMINSPYTKISLNGTTISGKLIVQEWLNGTKQVEPTMLPDIVIKDSNGTVIKRNELKYLEPYVYGYSIDIAEMDKTKGYTLEVQGTDTNNISTHKNVQVMFQEQEIGKVDNYTLKIESQKLIFNEIDNRYNGYMINSPYTKISLNGTTISGKLIVQEWLNGTKQIQPTTLPNIVIKDPNGTIIKTNELKYLEPYVYSYSIDVAEIDKTKLYTIEVQGTNINNISTHQNVQVMFQGQEIGKVNNYTLKIESGKLLFEEIDNRYNGYMTNSPYTKISLNGTTISGKLIIQEWLNGTKQIQPTTLPDIVIKDLNGTIIKRNQLNYIEPYVYSYSIDIEQLINEKDYILEVQGTNQNNTSTHQNVQIMFLNQEMGKIGEYIIKIENKKLLIQKINNKYEGYMVSYAYGNVNLSNTTLNGKVVVQEWLNGIKQMEPKTLPKVLIKDTNGVIIKEQIMEYIEPYVYGYNVDIGSVNEGVYTIEVQGTNLNNISTYQKIQIQYENKELGTIGKNTVKIVDKKLSII